LSRPIRNLILSGGVAHDYKTTSALLAEVLGTACIESEVTEDLNILKNPHLLDFDVLTLNCVRWSCRQTPDWKEWAFEIDSEQQVGLLNFLKAGKGLMAIHAAIINFDTWPQYGQILGGYWEWGKSSHGPYQPGYKMHIVDRQHSITRGVEDFEIHDELYHTLHMTKPVHVLITTFWETKIQPIAWTTEYGPARIHYNALGHGPQSFRCEPFQRLLQQGVLWASKNGEAQ